MVFPGLVDWSSAETCRHCQGSWQVLGPLGRPGAAGRAHTFFLVDNTSRYMISSTYCAFWINSVYWAQGFYQLLEAKVTVRCRQQDVEVVQVGLVLIQSVMIWCCIKMHSIIRTALLSKCVFIFCFNTWQAAINKSIKTYKESVKSNIVVRIDQERFLPADM